MRRYVALSLLLCGLACTGIVSAQAPAKVDFGRDVRPLLQQNCISCHGATEQNGGMRLDRKSSALKPAARRIVPGNSANSILYHRVLNSEFGTQMPPTGELRSEQIATIKAWIDQGAEWPDALSNEAELAPPDPAAIAAVQMLHRGDITAFVKAMSAKPSLLNARGPEGSTPFMYAVLYANSETLARLLKMGADPNRSNDAKATALMWAAHDLNKVRLLVAHGAKVNAVSENFRTPLMIAARAPEGAPLVGFLLEHGAEPNPNAHPDTASSPLLEAATVGSATSFELLMKHGAEVGDDAEQILAMAVTMHCARCLDLTLAHVSDKSVYTRSLQDTAYLGDAAAVKKFLDRGADVNAFDPFGHTPLMAAAASDVLPLDEVKLLIAHGADVNAQSKHSNSGDAGLRVLDLAKRHGQTPVLDLLIASGAKESEAVPMAGHMRPDNDLHRAIQDSLPLLQNADARFAKNSGCVSCHNNSLTAMTVGQARRQGFHVDETIASSQVEVNAGSLRKTRDLLHQGFLISVEDNFSEGIEAYVLMGLHAEGYEPDLDTDAAALHVLWRQKANGEWEQPHADTRQPLCLNYVGQTALAMRALQLYAPKAQAAASRRAIQLAASWLASAHSFNNDDRSWRVAGLAWAGTNNAATHRAMQELLANRKPDGGWSDLPSMESTAYATGKSLVALHLAGMAVSDPVYRQGVEWLLSHQDLDGSWYVQTRALAFQPWADAGFPHGYNQFISAAGTNWAVMALEMALPPNRETASGAP
jgi:ankyrin repeat protein